MKQWNAQIVRDKVSLCRFILNKNSLYVFILIGTVKNCTEQKMAVNVCHFVGMCVNSELVTSNVRILYSWFRASWLCINKIQRDATVCRCLFTVKLLYMFRVSQEYIKL